MLTTITEKQKLKRFGSYLQVISRKIKNKKRDRTKHVIIISTRIIGYVLVFLIGNMIKIKKLFKNTLIV